MNRERLLHALGHHDEPPTNPALQSLTAARKESLQNRVSDAITAFAGSMPFVVIHVIWFTAWILAGFDPYPSGLLTMIVSLEAIFLATFVMISQNRADARRQVIADQQFKLVQEEDEQNQLLIKLTKEIHEHMIPGTTP